MKQLFTLVLAAMAFVACTQNDVEELSANRVDAPETLTVGFEGGDTRIELNDALKTVWTKGDLASVFYKSDANQKWQYQGETGERLGTLKCVNAGTATTRTDLVVVAYPYNTNYILNRTNGNIEASLPAVQSYKDGSYGSEGNIMVAQSEFTQFSLKSVCGWLRVELTGEGESVKSITLRGNAGEQVAGLIYVDTVTAEATLASEMGEASDEEQVGGVGGGLEFDAAVFTEVTLNCGEGVELGSEAKSFYIGLLPQTFEEGITVEVESIGYENMTMTTTEAITIKRNHIKPMQTQEYNGEVYQIYDLAYATNDGKAINPFTIEGFGAELDENIYDASTGKGILRFKGSITTIPAQAFGLCENLTWIDIPEGITTIGTSAFTGCTALEEITIPASVTDVGNEAFKNCPCKAYINCLIPNEDYNAGVFQGAGFTEIIIGDNVTTIGDYAFQDCGSLTSVTIPDSVTTIGYMAFWYCSSLTSVTIPDSVTTIGDYAFGWCSSLTSVTIGDSVTTIGDGAFYECNSLTSVTIPDSVTTIGEDAFYECNSLTSVYCKATTPPAGGARMFGYTSATIYIPEGSLRAYKMAEYWSDYADCFVEYDFEAGEEVAISNKLFYTATASVEPNNTSAFNVTIVSNEWDETTGEGVITFDGELTTIGDEAFVECHSLTSVTIPDSVTAIGYMAFYDCNSLTIVTIPDSVTTIGEGAFAECHSLTSVTIPDSVTTIGYGAFALCHSLAEFKGEFAADGGRCLIKDNAIIAYAEASGTEYTIPDSVTTIGDGVFDGCESLTSVTIPDSVTTIGACAFFDCIGLTSVIIPDSVTTIGNYAFAYCDDLTSVYCKATTPPTLGFYVFDDNASGRKIYVTAESVEAYKAATNWSEYASYIVGYNFETGEVVE